jgi:hypothetical protein
MMIALVVPSGDEGEPPARIPRHLRAQNDRKGNQARDSQRII